MMHTKLALQKLENSIWLLTDVRGRNRPLHCTGLHIQQFQRLLLQANERQ